MRIPNTKLTPGLKYSSDISHTDLQMRTEPTIMKNNKIIVLKIFFLEGLLIYIISQNRFKILKMIIYWYDLQG